MKTEHNASPCVDIRNLEFAWTKGATILSVPRFTFSKGERLFLQGPSGSGKSTLLGVIAGVFAPTSGDVNILGSAFHKAPPAERDRVRADAMGVIFQQFNLVPYLNLVENVLLPCQFAPNRARRVGATQAERVAKATDLLGRLGLAAEAKENRPAAALSVGQQQRVAAARALIGSPSLVIADEPTSALDAETRDAFIETLLAEAHEAAVLFVSHDASVSKHFGTLLSMAELSSPDEDQSVTDAGARTGSEG